MVMNFGLIPMKKVKIGRNQKFFDIRYGIFITFLLLFSWCWNLEKIQAQTVPLNYDLPEDAIYIPVSLPDEPSFPDDSVDYDYENLENNSGGNLEPFNESIIINVPLPENDGETTQNRRSLADILIIEAMLLPTN